MIAYFISSKHQKMSRVNARLNRLRGSLKSNRISGEFNFFGSHQELLKLVDKNTSIGTKTFVLIGNDTEFHSLLNAVDLRDNVFGYIPLTQKSALANKLNISSISTAVKAIAQRKIVNFHLINVNQLHVVTELELMAQTNESIQLEVDNQLRLKLKGDQIKVRNVSKEMVEEKPIELEIYTTSKVSSPIEPNEQLRLPTRPQKLFADRRLLLHVKARNVNLSSKASFHNALTNVQAQHFVLSDSAKNAKIISYKTSERL